MKKILLFLASFATCIILNAVQLDEINKLSARATLENYPDAQTVLLYDDQQITFETDGTADDIDDMYQKALTDKGVQNLCSIPLHFNEFYEKYHIEKLEIIRDGKIIGIDVKNNSRISVDDSQMSANIYDPSNKILFLNIPGLQKNDILHLKVRRQTLRPRMKGFFTDITVLQSDEPILYYKVQYNAPKKMPLRSIMIKDEVKGSLKQTETDEKNRIIYTFTAENVPQIIPEPNSPPNYLFCQRVIVSSAAKWEEFSAWYDALCEPHLQKITPEMKSFTSDLIRNCKTPAEKLRKIFNFVSQQIRYMGVTTETEAPGYEPHDVNITFEKRYGVCRDKAALLVAMLRLADIPAYMTLFYAGAPKDAEVPNNYFNHAIVAAQLPGSKDYILMDPTDENSSELLPAYGANKSYLVARKNGDTIRLSPETDPSKNRLDINNNWTVSASGDLAGTTVINFYGINDNIYRDAFANWTNEYTKEFFKLVINRIFPGAEISEIVISPSNIRDLRQILSSKITFSVKNFVKSGEQISILPEHSLYNIFGLLNMQLKHANLKKRNHPLQFYSTAAVNEKTVITFAGNTINLELPEYEKISNPLFSFNASSKYEKNTLTENIHMALGKTLIMPAEYTALLNMLKHSVRECEKNILIQPVSVADNAESVLYELQRREIKFTDARNWTDIITAKYKVLDYAGVKKYAELSIPFNSACESASLISASVTTPDSKIHKITPEEVHIMDSGSTTNAPYYAPSKLLTVKFPHIVPQSVVEYKLEIKHKNMPFFYDTFTFASDTDMLCKEVIFENLPPSFICSAVPEGIEKIKEKKKLTVRKRNLRRIDYEAGQAPLAMFNDTIFCSTVSFQEYCSELDKLLNKAAANAPLAKAEAEKLVKNCKTPNEKVTAIRDFVDRQIRLAGPAFNDYNWTFSPADDTLKRSYGNCADRAILLKAMIDSIGLRSEWIARSSIGFPKIKSSYFSNNLRYFQDIYDNLLLLVFDGPQIVGILNENSRYAPVAQDNSRSCVSLNISRKSPQPRTEKSRTVNRSINDISLKINKDLTVEANVVYTFYGAEAEAMRRFFAESNSHQQKQFFEKQTIAFSIHAIEKSPWKTEDNKNNFKIKAILTIKDYLRITGNYAALKIPEVSSLANQLFATADRKTPIWLNNESSVQNNVRIELPPDYSLVSLPPSNIMRTVHNLYAFAFLSSIKNNTLNITTFLVNDIGFFDPENTAAIPALKKLITSTELNYIFLKRNIMKKQ